jgi:hypothetical protein
MFPQAPQLASDMSRLASQPSLASPLQSTNPDVEQCRSAFVQVPWQVYPLSQALPQVPQFFESVSKFTATLPQTVSPAGTSHVPATQVVPVAQMLPQVPQLLLLDEMSVSQPVVARPSQLAKLP